EATPDLHFGGRDWSPSLCFVRAGLRRRTPTTENFRRGELPPALLLCYEGRSIIYESPADDLVLLEFVAVLGISKSCKTCLFVYALCINIRGCNSSVTIVKYLMLQ
ncbi:hypothetical protein BHE74_00007939, partial [Ensete ventricosum]